MASALTVHGPKNPLVEAAGTHRTRVCWKGALTPSFIDGLAVSYCKDGMMWLGPINTPVRYTRLTPAQEGGDHVFELHISFSGLHFLDVPCRDFMRPILVVDNAKKSKF